MRISIISSKKLSKPTGVKTFFPKYVPRMNIQSQQTVVPGRYTFAPTAQLLFNMRRQLIQAENLVCGNCNGVVQKAVISFQAPESIAGLPVYNHQALAGGFVEVGK